MQIHKALNREILHDKEFPMNTIILTLDNKMQLVCINFNHSRKQNLELLVWLPTENKWVRTYTKNEYTKIMWDYYRKTQHKHNSHINYENLMHHERTHKHGSGGTRIYNGSITDYECTKNPLHDFRRCYN